MRCLFVSAGVWFLHSLCLLGAIYEKGDVVMVVRGEKLLFRDQPVRYADEGETFTILAFRPQEKKLFVQSQDKEGKTIALGIDSNAVVRLPAIDGRSCIIQGRRLDGAVIKSSHNNLVQVDHSGGATQFHSDLIPEVLLRDYSARQHLESGAWREGARQTRFGMTIGKCKQLIPGLELKIGSLTGNRYEQLRDDGARLHILTKSGIVDSITIEWKGEANTLLLDAILHLFAEGANWRPVRPSIGIIRGEWTRSDGGAVAQLLDYALLIEPTQSEKRKP